MNPEERARQSIDRLLTAAGWAVQDFKGTDLHAAGGIALREFELDPGHGTSDYLRSTVAARLGKEADAHLDAVLDALVRAGHVAIDGDKVAYHLPS